MTTPKLTKLELQILEILWDKGNASIREIQEAFRAPRPAYTTVQTTVYRLEGKNALRRTRKISNAHIFEPVIARDVTRRRMLDEILSFFGGRALPMMAQLAEAGKLTADDIRELEKTIKKRRRKMSRDNRHERQIVALLISLSIHVAMTTMVIWAGIQRLQVGGTGPLVVSRDNGSWEGPANAVSGQPLARYAKQASTVT